MAINSSMGSMITLFTITSFMFMARGSAQNVVVDRCRQPLNPCRYNSECCSGRCTIRDDEVRRRCAFQSCTAFGGECWFSYHCCSQNCTNGDEVSQTGVCGPSPWCHPSGGECVSPVDCCSEKGSLFNRGRCGDSPPCSASSGQCLISSDCCSENCTSHAEGSIFKTGICDSPHCHASGEECKLSSDCCSENDNCTLPAKGSIFRDIGVCGGSPPCNANGGRCNLYSDCCSGYCLLGFCLDPIKLGK